MNIKNTSKTGKIGSLVGAAVFTILFSFGGVHYKLFSSAATNHNPYGYVDSCALSGTTTELIGWASDPDAPAGAAPSVTVKIMPSSGSAESVTVPTNVAGYRDAAINSSIKSNHPGDPTTSVYGFVANFSLQYGGKYTVPQGTVINYGTGANAVLDINNGHNVDGDASKPYFVSDMIPAACLPPAPKPAPTPTPTPVASAPAATPTKAATTSKPVAKATTTIAAPAAVPAATTATPPTSGTASAYSSQPTVARGSVAAKIAVPTQNGGNVSVVFGSSADHLDQTVSQAVLDTTTTLKLTGLTPGTTYYYQVTGTNSDGTVSQTSVLQFTSANFTVDVAVTNNGKVVSGAKVTIATLKRTVSSDKYGQAQFTNVPAGTYKASISYQGHTLAGSIVVSTAKAATSQNDATSPAVIQDSVNFKLAASKSGAGGAIIAIVLLVLLIGGAIWFFLLRRKSPKQPRPTMPAPQPIAPSPLPVSSALPPALAPLLPLPPVGQNQDAVNPAAPHAGESLKDMVLRGMAEEAARRKNQQ